MKRFSFPAPLTLDPVNPTHDHFRCGQAKVGETLSDGGSQGVDIDGGASNDGDLGAALRLPDLVFDDRRIFAERRVEVQWVNPDPAGVGRNTSSARPCTSATLR